MPNIGPLELVIILVIALLILGPGRLPDVGSALGKSIREFRKAATDVQDSVRLDEPPTVAAPAPSQPVAPVATPVTPGADVPAADAPAQAAVDSGAPVAVPPPAMEPEPVGAPPVAVEPAAGDEPAAPRPDSTA
jgi:sec-independent protein translocase protein TatA